MLKISKVTILRQKSCTTTSISAIPSAGNSLSCKCKCKGFVVVYRSEIFLHHFIHRIILSSCLMEGWWWSRIQMNRWIIYKRDRVDDKVSSTIIGASNSVLRFMRFQLLLQFEIIGVFSMFCKKNSKKFILFNKWPKLTASY